MAALKAIWVKRAHRGKMDAADAVRLEAGRGIVGNANQGGKRQVTLIEEEVWSGLMASLGGGASPAARRANPMYDDWRGGAFAEVLDGGEARVGDQIDWE